MACCQGLLPAHMSDSPCQLLEETETLWKERINNNALQPPNPTLLAAWDAPLMILIAGIFPRASSKGAHGSQSDDSPYLASICAVVFTSPLTSRLCSQLQELQELPTSP